MDIRRQVFCAAFDLISCQYRGASLRCLDLQVHGFEVLLAVKRFDKASTGRAVDVSAALNRSLGVAGHLLTQDFASLVVQSGHSADASAPGTELLHQDLEARVKGGEDDGLIDVFSAVGDDGIHEEFLAGLVAKSGDKECVTVTRINDTEVLF